MISWYCQRCTIHKFLIGVCLFCNKNTRSIDFTFWLHSLKININRDIADRDRISCSRPFNFVGFIVLPTILFLLSTQFLLFTNPRRLCCMKLSLFFLCFYRKSMYLLMWVGCIINSVYLWGTLCVNLTTSNSKLIMASDLM